MHGINQCYPALVTQVLEGENYQVKFLNGETRSLGKSRIMTEVGMKVESGQWVAISGGEIVYRWKEALDPDKVNWTKLFTSIPPEIYVLNGTHNSQADGYDQAVSEDLDDYIRENYFQILDRVVELADLAPGLVLLDVGIGTGLLTERIQKGVLIFGIDISPKMMEKVKEKKLPVQLALGSFSDIPFPDVFFDRIVSTFAFHHLTPVEKEDAFIEMDRVLKPGGLWIIGDFMFESEEQKAGLVKRFTEEGRTDMIEEFEDEYFTYIDQSIEFLTKRGYQIKYEQGSTLSWILKAIKR